MHACAYSNFREPELSLNQCGCFFMQMQEEEKDSNQHTRSKKMLFSLPYYGNVRDYRNEEVQPYLCEGSVSVPVAGIRRLQKRKDPKNRGLSWPTHNRKNILPPTSSHEQKVMVYRKQCLNKMNPNFY